jgi:hypothetical protein
MKSKFIYINVISTCYVIDTWTCVVNVVQDIINKRTNVNAKGENEKMPLYLACENDHHGVISILCMVFNFLFAFFLFHRSYIVWFCVISCSYVNLSLALLCTTSDDQLFLCFSYVLILFSIIHHYLCHHWIKFKLIYICHGHEKTHVKFFFISLLVEKEK